MTESEGILSLSVSVNHGCMSPPPAMSGAGDNMAKHSARQAATALGDVPRQLAGLDRMTVGQLRQQHLELFGEPTRSRNNVQLRKKLAWRIQELAEGGLSERALAKILELGDALPSGWGRAAPPHAQPPAEPTPPNAPRDPRLPPPGTVLKRTHGGRQHEVLVSEGDFTYAGQSYRSLSAVARNITGTAWNGLAFFGLTTKARAA